MVSQNTPERVDALVVGAGFGGIYQLYSLLQLGLSVKVIDMAGDVGGTWYYNRYPGAMSDSYSEVYRFSWDREDLQTYPWSHRYVQGPDVLKYLEHVVERHDLRKHMHFNTELMSAQWIESEKSWEVQLSTGATVKATYLITALGLLSRPNFPDIPGLNTFKGTLCHTAAWNNDINLKDKRVGVIGCGSTGVQVITEIAKYVNELVCFQRHPQYTVPSGDAPVTAEYRKKVNAKYDQLIDQSRSSLFAMGFEESDRSFDSYTPEEREAIFESLWSQGNGFRFLGGGFNDIATNKEANAAACAFIRKKIAQIVRDPEKARKLQPYDHYARRPLCDNGYYEQFNRDNVSIVDLKETPITAVTGEGIVTTGGKVHELDVIIMATGFDAIDGNYNRVRIQGKNGETLKEHWSNGPTSYLGVSVANFPNLFMITGPQGPFCNIPSAIETHVEFITEAVKQAEAASKNGHQKVVETTLKAESEWNGVCEKSVEGSLFKETASWIFGANVPGKTLAIRFYFGGLRKFRDELQKVASSNYTGFRPFLES
ncbi:hypothetical protein RBB50_011223 [Rhinocladiella similis]